MIHVPIAVHSSQFPEQVRADLLRSLRTREIQHKFHYDSYKQSQKWLAVHEAHSPARNDPRVLAIYDEAFAWVATRFPRQHVHVIGLACGGGQKDAALLERLKAADKTLTYSPIDVSVPLVITAALRARPFASLAAGGIQDLERSDLPDEEMGTFVREPRVLTFFGMIPNCEPDVILPRVRKALGHVDGLLISANLAPSRDYREGVKRVLPQYDNAETSDWLLTFLYDLGVERGDGELKFDMEQCASGLLRIRADFCLKRDRVVKLGEEAIAFTAGERVRLFFSYRYTPELLKQVLSKHNLSVIEEWASEEEGVFAVTPNH